MSPLKARGWMGRPLSYSQPWKSPVCSRDANCLQPDTFLDLTERAEMRFKPVEAPLIPTSAGSEHVSGPILRALRENRSLLCPAHLSLAVCGTESQWLLGCQEKATSQGHGSGWSPGPPLRGGCRRELGNPCLMLGEKQEHALLTLQDCQCPLYFTVTTLLHTHIMKDFQCRFPQQCTSLALPACTPSLVFKTQNGHAIRGLHTSS